MSKEKCEDGCGKRLYIVWDKDIEERQFYIIHTSRGKAKAFHSDAESLMFTDIRCKVSIHNKKYSFCDREIGWFGGGLKELKMGLFDYLDYTDCPRCGNEDTRVYYQESFYCWECEEKEVIE